VGRPIYAGRAPSQRINAVVNVPLIDNQLDCESPEPTITKAAGSIQPAADRKDIDGQNLTNVRVKGTVEPTLIRRKCHGQSSRNDRSIDVSDQNAPGTLRRRSVSRHAQMERTTTISTISR